MKTPFKRPESITGGPYLKMLEYGRELLEKLLVQDAQAGGRLALLIGPQGSGKTTLLALLALELMERGECVIWRGRDLAQWHRLPEKMLKEKAIFWFHKDDRPEFWKLYFDGRRERAYFQYRNYERPEEIIESLEPGTIAIVYEPSYSRLSQEMIDVINSLEYGIITEEDAEVLRKGFIWWYEFLYKLLRRKDRRWISVFIDEVDDLFPETPSGILWKLLNWLKDSVKDFRKAFISLYTSTHTASNFFWGIRTKMQFYIYLPGARPEPNSIVNKKLILGLKPGQAIIERGNFGIIEFPKLPPKSYDILVEKIWTGEKPLPPKEVNVLSLESPEEAIKQLKELYFKGEIGKTTYYVKVKELKKKFGHIPKSLWTLRGVKNARKSTPPA